MPIYIIFVFFEEKAHATNIKRSLSFLSEIISSNISFVGKNNNEVKFKGGIFAIVTQRKQFHYQYIPTKGPLFFILPYVKSFFVCNFAQ